MNKKEFFKERIDKIAKESFNADQKEIAKKIINNTNDDDLDAVWGLISQRVKTGFVFDEAPETNHNCVAYIKENEKLSVNLGKKDVIEHSLIIGENYDALKNLLAVYTDKQGNGLIDVIYIDPPYNTEKSKEDGNDYKEEIEAKKFIYRDKYTRDGWLNMMNERLKLAKKLLSNNGVLFISIDDGEQAYLKILCDEIFGEENFIATYFWKKTDTPPSLSNKVRKKYEYILCYGKNVDKSHKFTQGSLDGGDAPLINAGNPSKELEFPANSVHFNIPDGIYKNNESLKIKLLNDVVVKNGLNENSFKAVSTWKWQQSLVNEEVEKGTYFLIKSLKFSMRYQRSGTEDSIKIPQNNLDSDLNVGTNEDGDSELISILGKKAFDNPKPKTLISFLLKMVNFEDDITVLDFFAGSGTTGQAVMELNEKDGGNRRFILATNNENGIALNVTRERLLRVITGKGSKGEDVKWQYSKDKKYLSNNSLRVFDIAKEELNITDVDKAEKIKKVAEENFKKLNSNYAKKGDMNIYNVLSSLTPIKEND